MAAVAHRARDAFEALGDPTRRALFERLAAKPMAVGELAAGAAVSRPAVSQHLKVLEEARPGDQERRRRATDLPHRSARHRRRPRQARRLARRGAGRLPGIRRRRTRKGSGGPPVSHGSERGMSRNRSVPGAGPRADPISGEATRRRNGRFRPYPFGARRISAPSALNSLCGGQHHGGLFACSALKFATRHAQSMTGRRP